MGEAVTFFVGDCVGEFDGDEVSLLVGVGVAGGESGDFEGIGDGLIVGGDVSGMLVGLPVEG